MNIFKINENKIRYTDAAKIDENYTEKMNTEYDWMAKLYGLFLFVFPLWKMWISRVIPYISGKKVLEVSFGSGYLMAKYGKNNQYEITGIDYNKKMIEVTQKKIMSKRITAELIQGNVEELPFPDNSFDTVINTMAFTGYPDGDKALCELKRVLKPRGKLLLVDFDYPQNRNIFGYLSIKIWEKLGDIMKDINYLLEKHEFEYIDHSIGGFGSVHLFVCTKR